MTPTHLQQWIQHPETLNRDTLYELRTLVARYPYFQSLRLLYLKNLYLLHDINFGAELRKAVLYVADRRVLFYFIEGDRYTLKSRKVSSLFSGDLEKEPSVDRTLSLIDAFLATVPEEHSQHTELDYAVDYTAYLMQEEPGVDAEDESEVPKLRGHELIDDFIQKSESSDASDTRREFLVEKEEETEEEEEPSVSPVTEELDDSCFTETLAKIYIKQHRYDKALAPHDSGHPEEKAHCPCEQGNARLRRLARHGGRTGVRRGDHPGGFGAFRHFPVPDGLRRPPRGAPPDFDLLRRAVLRETPGRTEERDEKRRPQASKLENGA